MLVFLFVCLLYPQVLMDCVWVLVAASVVVASCDREGGGGRPGGCLRSEAAQLDHWG